MSVECGECESDLRGGHALSCSRHPLHTIYEENLHDMNPKEFERWVEAEEQRQADKIHDEL